MAERGHFRVPVVWVCIFDCAKAPLPVCVYVQMHGSVCLCVVAPALSAAADGNWLSGQGTSDAKLNIALHAQSNSELHGFVAGSEVTTAGLGVALRALPEVGLVSVFAPHAYSNLHKTRYVCAHLSCGGQSWVCKRSLCS